MSLPIHRCCLIVKNKVWCEKYLFLFVAEIVIYNMAIHKTTNVWQIRPLCNMGPYQIKDISNLEKLQIKTARFVKQDYSKYNSITRMIHELGWKKSRR